MSDIGDITGRIALDMGDTLAELANLSSSVTTAFQPPDASALTGAIENIGSTSVQTGTAVDDLGTQIAKLLASGEAATTADALAIALGTVGDNAATAAGDLPPVVDAVGNLGDAAGAATPPVHDLGEEAATAGEHAHEAEGGLAAMAEQLLAFGEALAVTEALKEFGMEALTAADNVTHASIALTTITGSGETAKTTIEGLEKLGIADGLAFPSLLTAGTRMQQLLPAGTDVAAILAKIADGAAVMGTNIETAANKYTTLINQGTASARTMKDLGLNLTMLADALNAVNPALDATSTTAAKLFKDNPEIRAQVLDAALDHLGGTAQKVAEQTFGGQVQILANQWDAVMVLVGQDLLPVISGLTNLLKVEILPFLKGLAEDFTALPTPVKDTLVVVGLLAAAVPAVALAVAGFGLAVSGISAALPALTGMVGMFEAALIPAGVALSEVLIPLGLLAGAIAFVHFSGLDEEATIFAKNLWQNFTGIGDLLSPLTDAVKSVGQVFLDVWDTEVGIAIGAARIALGDWGTDWTAIAAANAEASKTESTAIGDIVTALELANPALQGMADAAAHVKDVLTETSDKQEAFIAGVTAGEPHLREFAQALAAISNAVDFLGGRYQAMTDAATANVARLQQANNDMARSAADAAQSVTQTTTAAASYDAGVQTLLAHQATLRENLDSAKASLELLTQAHRDGAAVNSSGYVPSLNDIGAAQGIVNTATEALYGKISTAADKTINLRQATHDWSEASLAAVDPVKALADAAYAQQQKIDQLTLSVSHAQTNLDNAIATQVKAKAQYDADGVSLGNLELATTKVEKAADILNTTQTKLNAAVLAAQHAFDISGGAVNAFNAFLANSRGANDIYNIQLQNMGLFAADAAPKMSPLNQAVIDLKVKTEATHPSLATMTTDVGNLLAGVASGQKTWTEFDSGLETIDKQIQQQAKTDLPAAIAAYAALAQKLIDGHAPHATVLADLTAEQKLIQQQAKEDLPAAIASQGAFIDELVRTHQPISMIADAIKDQNAWIIKNDQDQITAAEHFHTSASQYIIDMANRKQAIVDEANSVTNILGNSYVALMATWNDAFKQLGTHLTDGITGAKSWHDAWQGFLQDIEKEVLNNLIGVALKALESSLNGVIGGLIPSLKDAFTQASGPAAALTDALTKASKASADLADATAKAAAQAAQAGQSMGSGAGGLASTANAASSAITSMITMISSVIGAIAGIVGDVYLAAIDTKMFHVETSLLAIQNDTANRRADAWSQYGSTFDRLGEIWNAIKAIGGTVTSGATQAAQVGAATVQSIALVAPPIVAATTSAATQVAGSNTSVADQIKALNTQIATNDANILIASVEGNTALVTSLKQSNDGLGQQIAFLQTAAQDTNTATGQVATAVQGAAATAQISATGAQATFMQMYESISLANSALENLNRLEADLNQQLIVAEATGNATLVATLTTELGTVGSSISAQASLLSGITTAVQAVAPDVTAAFSTLQAGIALMKPGTPEVIAAVQALQVAIISGDISAIDKATADLHQQIVFAALSPAVVAAMKDMQTALASGDIAAVGKAATELTTAEKGNTDALAAAEKEIGDAIISGNQQALDKGLTDLANALTAKSTADTEAQIIAMDGVKASADDIKKAIDTTQATLDGLHAQQDKLNQDLLVALAQGNTTLATAIQGDLSKVGGQITTAEGTLTQLKTITGTGSANIVAAVNATTTAIRNLPGAKTAPPDTSQSGGRPGTGSSSSGDTTPQTPTAPAVTPADVAQAIANQNDLIAKLQGRLADDNTQLIQAAAAGNQALVASTKQDISDTQSRIKDAQDTITLLGGITDAVIAANPNAGIDALTNAVKTGSTNTVDAVTALQTNGGITTPEQAGAGATSLAGPGLTKDQIAQITTLQGQLIIAQQQLFLMLQQGNVEAATATQKYIDGLNGQITAINAQGDAATKATTDAAAKAAADAAAALAASQAADAAAKAAAAALPGVIAAGPAAKPPVTASGAPISTNPNTGSTVTVVSSPDVLAGLASIVTASQQQSTLTQQQTTAIALELSALSTDIAADLARLGSALDGRLMWETNVEVNALNAIGDGIVKALGKTLPAFDLGSGILDRDMVAQLHKGEVVLTADEVRAGMAVGGGSFGGALTPSSGGGSASPSGPITININGSNQSPKQIAASVMDELRRVSPKFSPRSI